MPATLHALVYTGKKADADSVADWWDARLACDHNRGGLPNSQVIMAAPPAAGLDSDFDAEAFLARELNGNPEGVVLAVPFSARVLVPTAAETGAYFTMKRALDRLHAIDTKGLATLTGAASKTVGCKGCGSKVARAYLKSVDCPVCADCLLPAGTRTRRAFQTATIAACVATVRRERTLAAIKSGTYLMVASRIAEDLDTDHTPFDAPTPKPSPNPEGEDQ